MGKCAGIITTTFLLTTASAFAGPLQLREVSRDANWVVHTDYERFSKSVIGKLIRTELVVQGMEEKMKSFSTVYSFHPIDDIRDVTVYGRGKDKEEAVVLVDGRFDEGKLIALVSMNAKHREIPYGGVVLHRWLHEERKKDKIETQMMYGCILERRIVVMSAGLDAVKRAVDVLKGSAANAVGHSFDWGDRAAVGVFFQAMATSVGALTAQEKKATVLRQTDTLDLVIGEEKDRFYCNLNLSAKSSEVAQNVDKMLAGMIAFASLAGEAQPQLAELAKHLQLSWEDKTVHLHFESEPQLVFDLLKEQWSRSREQQDKEQ
jgi:hypothetical protein